MRFSMDFQVDSTFSKDYRKILEMFQFDEVSDARGRDVLGKMLPATPLEDLIAEFERRIRGTWVVVVGSGPSAPKEIELLLDITGGSLTQNVQVIAADGATRLLLEEGITPTAVFTDLDGITSEIMAELSEAGCFFVVHAHGDNISLLKKFQPEIVQLQWVIGTTQTRPKGPVINPGGFTDGDRILYFLSHFPPDFAILMVGMDFGPIVGKYSKPTWTTDLPASPFKAQKLQVAVDLLTKLLPTMSHAIYELEQGYPFPNVQKLTAEELAVHLEEFTGPRDPPDRE
ncbi:MAG TPA: 6-hydroxymethylpterin diphosphokinase MptE-like protein [Candidatus Lokiarchaeia archaeon]|nr:6-hydroxymethylpterin diphosphokinase MptE-like protein [Candidatus Lokiarchaeia archaeon]